MASKVEIANTALSIIGEQPITSFSDDSRSARVVNQRYDTARRAVLRDHPWNSAKSRTRLAALTQSPEFGWQRQFQLPSDWLRIVRINGAHPRYARFEIEGERVLTDMGAPLHLIYVRDEKDTSKYDALLTEAFAARLASEIAMPITQSRQNRNDAWSLYKEKLQDARSVDAMDEPGEVFDADLWLNSRLSGPGPHPDYHWRDIDT
jgi:hypothetical protein